MNRDNKMGIDPIGKLIWNMSLPPLCSMFLQYSYNFIDTAYVAQIGENALTAISLSFPLSTLMIASSIGIGVGINILISRNIGEGNQKEADKITASGIFLSILVGFCLNILVLAVLPFYFKLYTEDRSIYKLAYDYMFICAFMQIPNMVHIAIQKILQGTGNMVAPMWCQIIGALFNIILDPFLIFGWGIFPEMGIKGAAISTVLGYTLSMIIIVIILLFTKQKVVFKIVNFKINKRIYFNIIKYGAPSFFLNALGGFMILFVNLFLISYGTVAVAFFGAYYKLQHLVVMTVNGLIQGVLPIMSYNYGSGNFPRLNETARRSLIIAFIMMVVGGTALLLFPSQFLALFNATEEMITLGKRALPILVTGFGVSGISMICATYLQALGYTNKSIVITFLRQGGLLFPFIVFGSRFDSLTGIWIAFPITEFFTFILAWIMYKKATAKY